MHAHDAAFAHPPRTVEALGIEPGMKVADFGSGSGAYALLIAGKLGGVGHVYAVDVQRDLLRRTHNEAQRRGFKHLSVIWGDLEHEGGSKLADASLELVLISNLLFQAQDKPALLAEARRVLRPHARLAVIDWSETPRAVGGQAPEGWRIGPAKGSVVPKAAARELAQAAGFELIREFPAGAHHYGLLFRKKL